MTVDTPAASDTALHDDTEAASERAARSRTLDCGWGRLHFGPHFHEPGELIAALGDEREGTRDIATGVIDPHVLVAHAPDLVFVDPSHTYRLQLEDHDLQRGDPGGLRLRPVAADDAAAIDDLYRARDMVPLPGDFLVGHVDDRELEWIVAEDESDGTLLGTITGIDHAAAFGDAERGASFWCLAVDPNAAHPGIGESLVRALAARLAARGSRTLDLSVMHDNGEAIALYEKLGFRRLQLFTLKCRNRINESLFVPRAPAAELDVYAAILVDEAHRRGIRVDVQDAASGLFRLEHGGRSIRCRESLSELTSAVALAICDDKRLSRRIVERAGVRVPETLAADADDETIHEFLERHRSVVVKPARGEQGDGVSVELETVEAVREAIDKARAHDADVLIEACVGGDDLRLIVIDYRLVAAAIRRPATVTGNGSDTVRELIRAKSRRRESATDGESSIPLDEGTERTLEAAGLSLDAVPGKGREIAVRRTANLHTGGVLEDVTEALHPTLVDAAVRVARSIDIPVVGVDFMIEAPDRPHYHFIEANERPGLAHHEPQPTAERFIDLLFPLSRGAAPTRIESDAPSEPET